MRRLQRSGTLWRVLQWLRADGLMIEIHNDPEKLIRRTSGIITDTYLQLMENFV